MQYGFQIPKLNGLTKDFAGGGASAHGQIKIALEKSAIIIQSLGKQEAPVRSGKLRSSIVYVLDHSIGKERAIIGSRANYATIIETGRGMVVPVNKKVLATKINPGWGTKSSSGYYILGKTSKAVAANPYMRRAFEKGIPEVAKQFEIAAKKIVQTITK